jgi:hypothetical protein
MQARTQDELLNFKQKVLFFGLVTAGKENDIQEPQQKADGSKMRSTLNIEQKTICRR